ncbi:hypothetical protein [Arthrobacter sp. CAN_C5]|uniref:hypothetical protein n=1 Tax=Arthrobacter sp. CAN_C5 TaxID=2760706 RepID=UPI001AE1D143|nr:hypothetical protein [Arthrobacter sp. CAN_C5]MBP2216040.1 hypothetical protein [Arthrobacter sp. CAN_C5]
MNAELRSLHRGALQRRARQRVDLFDDMRAVKIARGHGLAQREIADLLVTSQDIVHRLLKAVERRGGDLTPDPAELIMRAFAYDSPRGALLNQLKAYPYDFGKNAPSPYEGRLPGTWDQIVVAFAQEMLSREEFDELKNAVGR